MGFEIRADRGESRGRGGLPRERAEYFRLMDQGYSSAAACRAVGVTIRTGGRWRNGRSREAPRRRGASPAGAGPSPSSPGSGRYLSEDERIAIADRLLEGASMRAIVYFAAVRHSANRSRCRVTNCSTDSAGWPVMSLTVVVIRSYRFSRCSRATVRRCSST